MDLPKYASVQTRLLILVIGLFALITLSFIITGSPIPDDSRDANIFQNGLLLVILGSLLLEDKFTKPVDAIVNSLTGFISLVSIYSYAKGLLWTFLAIYCIAIFVIAITCISTGKVKAGFAANVNSKTYEISIKFGQANLMFSIIFLHAIFVFYNAKSNEAAALVVFWGMYIAIWPLRVPQFVESIFQKVSKNPSNLPCGTIFRVDYPDLVRVKLNPEMEWKGYPFIACLGDGSQRSVLPLFSQIQDTQVIATGLMLDSVWLVTNAVKGEIYDLVNEAKLEIPERPLGLVREQSSIERIVFETWKPDKMKLGLLIYCHVKNQKVYYQVTDASTQEEMFERHEYGFQITHAYQLGTLNKEKGFIKFDWVPEMNTPIYEAPQDLKLEMSLSPSQMSLGFVPGSNVEVICDVSKMISHHTAIIGVTGAGKTQLAYRIIGKAVENETKVLCVDITGDYKRELTDAGQNPVELSIGETEAITLGEKIFAVETGEYGAGKEKSQLDTYKKSLLQTRIIPAVKEFIESDKGLGVFTIPSISDNHVTIGATEIYLTAVFNYTRQNREKPQNILVVLEEAHSIIPETFTLGIEDKTTKGLVSRIGQIALQGRRYNVGLLIIAQRTATVSKVILTQCNTMISFATFDETGKLFLSNFFGEKVSSIPNLASRNSLVFGKGIMAERPIIIRVHENQAKPN